MKACTSSAPVNTTLGVIGGKWKPVILWHLYSGPLRFSALKKAVAGITQKMLTDQLRELEKDGIIVRTVFAEVPPRVEYAFSEYGQTLSPVLQAMAQWGEVHEKRRES